MTTETFPAKSRYVVSVDFVVEATSEDEASMIVERAVAGQLDVATEPTEEGV